MCHCINIEVGSYGNQVALLAPWNKVICVDKCLAEEIQYLWSLGITTTGCCCGHNKLTPFIAANEIDQMLELGYVQIDESKLIIGGTGLRTDHFYPKTYFDT